MSYNPGTSQIDGGIPETRVGADDVESLLYLILRELKKINIHLESMTDERVRESDIE